jgi:hypothetical protein
MRRNAFILFWGFLLSIVPPFLIIAFVAIYYSGQYPNAFSKENILSEGRRAMYSTLDGLRPIIGLVTLAGLVSGLILGFLQKLPGTKLRTPKPD